MPRRAEKLTAAGVRNAKPGRYGDGNGLYLFVRSVDARFWVFRYTPRGGKMREMGLGRAGDDRAAVSLASARDKAAELHKLVRAGIDPLAKREADEAAAKAAAQDAAARAHTFRQAAKKFIEAHEAGWKNEKHQDQWRNTLATYAYTHMGDIPVADVSTTHVLAVLEPIWRTKPETATRVRGRIEKVLDYAKAMGWRSGENPAAWKGHLALTLPARSKVAKVQHHAALPWPEIAAFMVQLREQAGTSARALEFAILTAARSGEVLGARWNELDMAAKLWTVPAERMKAGREHRVPLSTAALAVLKEMSALRIDEAPAAFVFPGGKGSRPLSNMALSMTLRRMKHGDITPHGFRSCFRDWAGEATNTPREVAEAALAHTLESKTEAAYARGDLFEKRRRLMDAWAAFCAKPPKQRGEVITLAAIRAG
jgi:integrase